VARSLARAGASVVLCEALNYLGGCASSFEKVVPTGALAGARIRYETGATLFCGLAPQQHFARMAEEEGSDVKFALLDDVLHFRSPHTDIVVPHDPATLIARLTSLPGAPAGTADFVHHQQRVAKLLWELFHDPSLLPPLSMRTLLRHALRLPRYASLLRWLCRPVHDVMAHHGVANFAPLRAVLQGLCQITLQTSLTQAEALFALSAMDYPYQGAGHVVGGVGRLAQTLADGITKAGGHVWKAARATSAQRTAHGHRVTTRAGDIDATHVVINALPADAAQLCGVPATPRIQRLTAGIQSGWSAVMLYGVVEDHPDLPAHAHHVELVDDEHQAFVEGNHVFVSMSARADGAAPAGHRAFTASTHVALQRLGPNDAALCTDIQQRMQLLIARMLPDLHMVHLMTASPRTWQRFVRRTQGAVGGIPRRAGWSNYRDMWPVALSPAAKNVWLVGDSVFPGQSTLAASLSGVRLAHRLLSL
jgi:phytoene dehydrogenase-like protein